MVPAGPSHPFPQQQGAGSSIPPAAYPINVSEESPGRSKIITNQIPFYLDNSFLPFCDPGGQKRGERAAPQLHQAPADPPLTGTGGTGVRVTLTLHIIRLLALEI